MRTQLTITQMQKGSFSPAVPPLPRSTKQQQQKGNRYLSTTSVVQTPKYTKEKSDPPGSLQIERSSQAHITGLNLAAILSVGHNKYLLCLDHLCFPQGYPRIGGSALTIFPGWLGHLSSGEVPLACSLLSSLWGSATTTPLSIVTYLSGCTMVVLCL